jgi:hypothetical protein
MSRTRKTRPPPACGGEMRTLSFKSPSIKIYDNHPLSGIEIVPVLYRIHKGHTGGILCCNISSADVLTIPALSSILTRIDAEKIVMRGAK